MQFRLVPELRLSSAGCLACLPGRGWVKEISCSGVAACYPLSPTSLKLDDQCQAAVVAGGGGDRSSSSSRRRRRRNTAIAPVKKQVFFLEGGLDFLFEP